MGTNRKLPFGYRMEFGRIAIHLGEANWVQHIFTQYNQGVSFQGITDKCETPECHMTGTSNEIRI